MSRTALSMVVSFARLGLGTIVVGRKTWTPIDGIH